MYVCSPAVLTKELNINGYPDIYLAGQITGVEGYVESAMVGLITGIAVSKKMRCEQFCLPPASTMSGSLIRYILYANPKSFTPMNAMFNIIPGYNKNKKMELAENALELIRKWRDNEYE